MKAITLAFLLLIGATASATEYTQVLKNGVRIRAAPATGTEIIAFANEGDVFELYKRSGQWVAIIMFSGDVRYIHSSLVRSTQTVPVLPAAGIREQACVEITEAQIRASAEAQQLFPSHFDRMIDHERLLIDRWELPIFQQYGIAPAHNQELLTECVTKKWR